MEDFNPNWLALIVATLIPLAVGFIWYGPLFGKAWQKEVGMSDEELKNGNMVKIFGLSIVFSFILAFAIIPQVLFGGAPGEPHGVDPFMTFKHGALHGALLGLLIILPVIATIALYERKSLKYVLMTIGYWTISLALMGGVINVWT